MLELKAVASGPKPVPVDPYDAVLADLRAKRDAIDTTIATLESLRDGRLGITPVSLLTDPTPAANQVEAGVFLGMSIVDAAKKLLKLRKRAMANAEILKDLQAGGLPLSGSDPLNVVSSVLTRRFNTSGDVVRVGRGVWGLKEWYPGRTFKPVAKSGQAQLSEPAEPEGEPKDADWIDPNDLLG